ncbi:MAG: iron ABC transporter permease [Deltaproteobacteria bacterium]|nr:iron ABC transporter permease [Deltaproteobacteria bacterium]
MNGLLLALLVASLVVAVTLGPVALSWSRVFAAGGGPNPDAVILFRTRLPRVLLAAIVGGALGISGAALQALLRNPLAEPHLVGISSGAALAAALALVTMPVVLGQAIVAPVAAFAGALVSIWIVVRLAFVGARVEPTTLLLIGVIYNAFTGALLMFLNSIADLYQVHGVLFWLMGHLGARDYPTLAALALYSLAGLGLLLRHARDLDCLSLGDERAAELGVDVERARRMVFVAAALLVGAVVSVSGLIGFVGLVVPHLVRLVFGADHRLLLPASYLAGAIFLVWADTVARTVLGVTEIPVGVVTALCGAPVFAYLLRRERTLVGW